MCDETQSIFYGLYTLFQLLYSDSNNNNTKKGQTITTLSLSFSVNHKTFSPNYIDQSEFIPTKYIQDGKKDPTT